MPIYRNDDPPDEDYPEEEPKTEHLNIRLTKTEKLALKAYAKKHGQTATMVISRMIENLYLESERA